MLTGDFLRVRTLTGKEIELDIESDYKVRFSLTNHHPTALWDRSLRRRNGCPPFRGDPPSVAPGASFLANVLGT
jgi:hypothetical protein